MAAVRISVRIIGLLVVGALSGCAFANDPKAFFEPMTSDGAEKVADLAMSAMTRGDYPKAEKYAIEALRRDPRHPIALFVAGVTYQAAGRYDLARQYYEVLVTNKPQATIMMPDENGAVAPRSVMELAQANMAAVDRLTGRSQPRTIAQSGRPASGGLESAMGLAPRDDGQARVGASQAEMNASGRFKILRRLLDEGLITQDEYGKRRAANMGALLPLTHGLPGAGLERPIPREQQVVDRLAALGRALESREITPAELTLERTAILDALLPAAPRKTEMPVLPPRDVIESAAAIGRLERLRNAGLISAEDMGKEKAAIEKVLDSQLAAAPVSGSVTGLRPATPEEVAAQKAAAKAASGVVLATSKTEAEARAAWTRIQAKFPEQLGKLELSVSQRKGKKGLAWWTVAGPLASKAVADDLCKTLRLHRQYCDSTSFQKP